MKDIFRPEDFIPNKLLTLLPRELDALASIANARFRSWLSENGKKVYGIVDSDGYHVFSNIAGNPNDTHTAYLIGVEELRACEHPKEKVKMNTMVPYGGYKDHSWFNCGECGAAVSPGSFVEMSSDLQKS